MKTLIALLLIPSIALAEGGFEIRPWAPGELGIAPAPQVQAPVYGVPVVPPANQPSYNSLLQAETRARNMETIQRRDQVIDNRLGIYANSPGARSLMGTIVEVERNSFGN